MELHPIQLDRETFSNIKIQDIDSTKEPDPNAEKSYVLLTRMNKLLITCYLLLQELRCRDENQLLKFVYVSHVSALVLLRVK